MSTPVMSRETAQIMADAKAAARELQSQHFVWMVDAAVKHFGERIERWEREIVRHEHFKSEPLVRLYEDTLDGSEHDSQRRSKREREIAKSRDSLRQDRAIIRFLVIMQQLLLIYSAEQWAASIDFSSMFGRKGRK